MIRQSNVIVFAEAGLFQIIVLIFLVFYTTATVRATDEVRNGKQVYDASCGACHTAGVLQAPRLGKREDWSAREQQGLEVLMTHALKGFKNMPAKGGNPTIKDEEIKKAVVYMLVSSGFDQYAEKPATEEASKKKTDTAAVVKKAPAKKTLASSVNQFNRLMKSSSEWNLPPAKDGIHDSESPGTLLLQEPRVAFDSLSKSKSGNRVDWVKALEGGEISPRYERLNDDAKPVVMDLNIVREVKGSMPDVVYPHKQHTEWLDCSNCHPAIFIPQKGANQISMASILLGQKCGVCHGKVAFPVAECRRCHSKQKATETEAKNKTN
ncbi:MAG: c-type cytochrome [Gammaproteobacteria bacterium]|nr:c-type cytochrome [Gammaproteobacteria bacterium]MDH3856733.1 c-type cytochrome [Gammaproteobacteria bacterium]